MEKIHFRWAFMDFRKSYDLILWHSMWQMLRVHGVEEKLMKAVLRFEVDIYIYI